MLLDTIYPFGDDCYVLITLKDHDGIIVGSIEGVPNLMSIEVKEQYKRLGYGTLLVNAFKMHFISKDKNQVFVAEVDGNDRIARQFWASCGFVEDPKNHETFTYISAEVIG